MLHPSVYVCVRFHVGMFHACAVVLVLFAISQVAMGIPLHEIPDIRGFYGKPDRYGHDGIDFMSDDYAPIRNHIIAARITAENPDEAREGRCLPCFSFLLLARPPTCNHCLCTEMELSQASLYAVF